MAEIVTEATSYTGENRPIKSYLARPEGEGPFPGIVVIHEAYGLNDNIREIAGRFAAEGYVALAVDLFSGRNTMVCMFRFLGGQLFDSLNHEGIRDLKQAITYLGEQPGVDAQRLGAIGFCLGGGLAIALSCADPRVRAIAPFYGSNPRPLTVVSRACPVVGSYPDKDFTTKQGQALDQALTEYTIAHDIKIYPGSKHSFFNDKGRNYNESAAQDSWQRILTFFKEHISQN